MNDQYGDVMETVKRNMVYVQRSRVTQVLRRCRLAMKHGIEVEFLELLRRERDGGRNLGENRHASRLVLDCVGHFGVLDSHHSIDFKAISQERENQIIQCMTR